MQYRVYTCGCGHKQRLSEFQIGMDATCPECKADIRFTEENTEPIGGPTDGGQGAPSNTGFEAPESEQPRHGRNAGDHCARCGRKFRGDWDQHESPQGILCNVCANLAMQEGPGTLKTEGVVKPVQSLAAEPEEEEGPPIGRHRPGFDDEPIQKSLVDRYPTQVKTIVWIGVALVFFAAIYYSVINPESADVAPERTPEEIAQMEEAVSELPGPLMFLGTRFFVFLGMATTLFLTLRMTNKLPHDSFAANAVHVAVMGVGFMVLQGIGSFVPLGSLLAFLIILYILWDYYDFDLYAFVMWFVLGTLVGVLVWGARTVVFGILANALRAGG